MKSYFIYENTQQLGPFSVEDLKEKLISSNTPIWRDGMTEWSTAASFPELASILQKTPPPFSFQKSQPVIPHDNVPSAFRSSTEKTGFQIGNLLSWKRILGSIILIGVFAIYKTNQSGSYSGASHYPNEKSPEELKMDLKQLEHQYPGKYITGTFKNWENLIGERVVELKLHNTSTLAHFKDVSLKIIYLSKTGTELGNQHVTVYEYLAADAAIMKKIKLMAPSSTEDVRVVVESAQPAN